MSKTLRFILIILLFLTLIFLRSFSQHYFYDPLMEYFKSDFLKSSFPEMNYPRFFLNLSLRFFLNTTVSLGIIYLAFKNLKVVVFSIKLYVILFVFFTLFLFILLKFQLADGYLLVFYIRRFLIQPLLLLILLPAFYYQKLTSEK